MTFLNAHWYRTMLTLLVQSFWGATQPCQLIEITPVLSGKYCPVKGGTYFNLPLHYCRAMCMQARNCAAYNYNISDNTCSSLAATCPQPQSNPVMEFGMLTVRTPRECCHWIPFTRGAPRDERMVAEEQNPGRTVARTTNHGANYFGYHHDGNDACYIATSSTNGEKIDGYPCQRLRVAEGCTVFWAPYIAGDPLPAKAVIGGKNADDDNVYVASMYGKCGYYPHGATYGSVPHGEGGVQTARSMKLLVLI